MGQALVKFLDNQYASFHVEENRFVHGVLGIFDHGGVVDLAELLHELS